MPATTIPLLRALAMLALGMGMLASPAPARSAERAPLTVFAAASLKESMDEAAAKFGQDTGQQVVVSYAASSALARQIEQGAPADVFVSADLDWMDWLQARTLVDAGSRSELLGNRLVLVAPQAGAGKVDLSRPGAIAATLGKGRLAIAQTASVPAGKYGRAALESLGQWNGLSARLAETESVRAALMLVARGEAPLGIVYASDAKAEPRVRVVATFPDTSHPPIVYPVAALRDAPASAREFVRWLSSPAARAIFERRGFDVLD